MFSKKYSCHQISKFTENIVTIKNATFHFIQNLSRFYRNFISVIMEPKLVLLVWAMWVTLSVIIFWEKVTPSQLLLTSNPTIAKDSQNLSQLRELHAKWQNCLISWFQVIWFRGKSLWGRSQTTLTIFWLFFDHLPPCVDIFYGMNVDKKWTILDHLPTYLVL